MCPPGVGFQIGRHRLISGRGSGTTHANDGMGGICFDQSLFQATTHCCLHRELLDKVSVVLLGPYFRKIYNIS